MTVHENDMILFCFILSYNIKNVLSNDIRGLPFYSNPYWLHCYALYVRSSGIHTQ